MSFNVKSELRTLIKEVEQADSPATGNQLALEGMQNLLQRIVTAEQLEKLQAQMQELEAGKPAKRTRRKKQELEVETNGMMQ